MATGAFAVLIAKNRHFSTVFAIIGLGVLLFLNHYRHQTLIQEERKSLTATGTIEAKSILASFKVAGRIDSLTVEEGSYVEKGRNWPDWIPGKLPPG